MSADACLKANQNAWSWNLSTFPESSLNVPSAGATWWPRCLAPVLEKVHMPPASLDGVVNRAQTPALGTFKLLSGNVLKFQLQAFWFAFKHASADMPLIAKAQCQSKKLLRCHHRIEIQKRRRARQREN